MLRLCIVLLFSAYLVIAQNIKGVIKGSKDSDLLNAKLEILSNSPVHPKPVLDSLSIPQNGKFLVNLKQTGFYVVRFDAEKHQPIEVPLFIDSDEGVEINIKLGRESDDDPSVSVDQPEITFTESSSLTAFVYKLSNAFQPHLEKLAFNSPELDETRRAMAEWALVNLTRETNLVRSQKLLNIFPPYSNVWSISPSTYTNIISVFDKSEQLNYLKQIIDSHNDPTIKPYFYLVLMSIADKLDQKELITEYYKKFELRYPESRYYDMISSRFAPKRAIQKGKAVPDFNFISIDDSSITVSKESMHGKIYLIDFWGSWCIPCIKEMENLHRIHEKYDPLGLEILSVSLDMKLEDAIKFREKRWPMPWFNSFIEYKPNAKVVKDFELASIPKPILVNSDGKIIAVGKELLGENLGNMLHSVFVEDK